MSDSLRMTALCQDPGDGSGDIITDLPQEVRERMHVVPGAVLNLELIEGVLVISAVRDAEAKT